MSNYNQNNYNPYSNQNQQGYNQYNQQNQFNQQNNQQNYQNQQNNQNFNQGFNQNFNQSTQNFNPFNTFNPFMPQNQFGQQNFNQQGFGQNQNIQNNQQGYNQQGMYQNYQQQNLQQGSNQNYYQNQQGFNQNQQNFQNQQYQQNNVQVNQQKQQETNNNTQQYKNWNVDTSKIESKQAKLQDSNVVNIGSQMDKDLRQKVSQTEKEWQGVGQTPGLKIWRIENFQVVPWPTDFYGSFYDGDSYIILHTMKKNNALVWDIHFWIGNESSQDEYGTAAYKTVELDDNLGGAPIQHREVQNYESQKFLSLFPNGRKIMHGGIKSGFNKVKLEEFRPCLYHIKGNNRILIVEVPIKCASLNNSDGFILDLGTNIYLWVGEKATKVEKYIAGILADEIKGKRKEATVHRLEQNGSDEFWKALGGKSQIRVETPHEDEMETLSKRTHVLFKLSDESGRLQFTKVHEGQISRKMLKTADVFIIDVGNHIICWVGNKTSPNERKNCMIFAQNYIGMFKRPNWLPIIKILEGHEDDFFYSLVKRE